MGALNKADLETSRLSAVLALGSLLELLHSAAPLLEGLLVLVSEFDPAVAVLLLSLAGDTLGLHDCVVDVALDALVGVFDVLVYLLAVLLLLLKLRDLLLSTTGNAGILLFLLYDCLLLLDLIGLLGTGSL